MHKIYRSMDGKPVHAVLTSGRAMASLTPRELDVLHLVARGEPSRAIAAELDLTEATVKRHLYNIYRKLEVRNRVEATNWYLSRRRQESRPR